MSRSISRALLAVVRAATGLQSPVRRAMTRARLVEALEHDGALTVETSRGALRFLTSRGHHLAAAAVKFSQEEPETLAWIDSFRSGETFWDVGAATGLFTCYAARIPGLSVHAFEPKATSYGVLVEHLALNGLGAQVVPLAVAFSDTTAVTRIELANMAPGSGGNSVRDGAPSDGAAAGPFPQGTLAWRMDDFRRAFGLRAPDHLKIDVDGIEAAILRGAEETLREVTSVLIEVEGDNLAEVASRIEAPLAAAGLAEVVAVRGSGSGKNRLYRRGG